MHSGSLLYQLIVLTGLFGTLSVCIAFAFLLPGVGQALAMIWTFVTADWFYQKRVEQREGKSS
jgi:hypothetical protein